MKLFLKRVGIIFILVLVTFCLIVSMQPANYRVERSAVIGATPEGVFPHLNDLHKWQAWSPWAKRDPATRYTYDGPPAGVGAAFTWAGNAEVGEGKMAIIESRPNELVRYQLDFIKPMQGSAEAEIALKPEGAGSRVTWAMIGKNNFLSKAFCLFVNMDKMVGGDFEAGLANLRGVVEAAK
jgi:hypothetical protein